MLERFGLDGQLGMAGWGLGVKRRCGTCRHFSGDDDVTCGSCLHPERASLGLVVTVRATELNCRGGWGKDLWDERPTPAVAADVVIPSDIAIPNSSSNAELSSPVGSVGHPGEGNGVDLLVDVAMPMREIARQLPPEGPPATSAAADSTGGLDDTRRLIRRAHDVHRLRLANRTRATGAPTLPGADLQADVGGPDEGQVAGSATGSVSGRTQPDVASATASPAPVPESATEAPVTADPSPGHVERWAARMAELGPVPPVPVSEIRSDLLGWGASRQEAEDRFDSVPALDPSFRLPFIERSRDTRLRAGFDDADLPSPPEEEPPVPLVSEPPMAEADDRAAAYGSELGVAAEVDRSWRSVDGQPAESDVRDEERVAAIAGERDPWPQHKEPLADEPVWRATPRPSDDGLWERRFAPSHYDADDAVGFDDVHDRLALAFGTPDDVRGNHALRVPESVLDAGVEVEPDTVNGSAGAVDDATEDWLPYDDQFASVPRCCRSCRDFRPAEGGERGWCTSAWAFQHRRMVHADELACFSAIGIWWLPSDSLWLDDLDFDHAEPTPLIDAMLARRAAADRMPQRERRRGRR